MLTRLADSARTFLAAPRLRWAQWALATLVVAGVVWLGYLQLHVTYPEPRCMTETTLLYVLSTLAQTCAALAAFVGAVGLFRLQTLRDQRAGAEHHLRGLMEMTTGQEMFRPPITEVLAALEEVESDRNRHNNVLPRAQAARTRWLAFVPRLRDSRDALIVFEFWNVVVIVASLVGFNYVAEWAAVPWLCRALGLVAVSTGVITGVAVWVWTRGVET